LKKGDIILGGGECWRVVEPANGNRLVKVIQVAGPEVTEVRTSEVPKSFFNGKTLFRAVSDLSDLDATLAVAEVTKYVDVSELGSNPRLWVAAFLQRYQGSPIPDSTTLLGWYSRMIQAGEDKAIAEIEEEARQKKLEEEKQKKLEARKKRALKKKNDAKAVPKLRTRKGRAVPVKYKD